MLHHMRNIAIFGNGLLGRALELLRHRLPDRWVVRVPAREPRGATYRPDALLEFTAPDGTRGIIVVEAKRNVTAVGAAAFAPRLAHSAKENKAAGILLVSEFLSPLTRDRLRAAGISYVDLTGNVWFSLDRPAAFIETQGADRNPAPPERDLRSLKGATAARIVRALCDWRPPVGVRELARRSGADPGYVTRVLSLLEKEDVVKRGAAGDVTDVEWKDLLKRWAQDYDVARTNRAVAFLEPRGADAFLTKLRALNGKYALTGSRAIPRAAVVAPATLTSCYVEGVERTATELQLRTVEAGSNVILLEPYDSVVWERTRTDDNLTSVAVSQCAVDLLTGSGREPSEAENLLSWMSRNEHAWRA